MALWTPPPPLGKTQTNVAANARAGTVITSGAGANTEGAFSSGQLIATTNEDTYGISIMVTGVAALTTATPYLLDIGIGASGSERTIITNLDCWGAGVTAATAGLKHYYFPVFIPKGERVAARAQALAVSDTASVAIYLHQAPNTSGYGAEVPVAWESLGTLSGSNGVSVTPASGAFGSWTTILDPITKSYKWWHVGYGALTDTSILTGGQTLIEIGFGDTSAAVTTIGSWSFDSTTSETINGPCPSSPVYYPVLADTVNGVFARIASFETEARSVLVYAAE